MIAPLTAQWKKIEAKIDAMSLRERAMLFAIGVFLMGALFSTFVLDPKFKQQKEISQKASTDRQQILALQAEINARIAARDEDPDMANRTRLESLRKQSADIKTELQGMQKGLVSPDKMATLLEDILVRNGRLRLITLKTIPVAPLIEPPVAAPAPPVPPTGSALTAQAQTEIKEKQAAKEAFGTVYKHAVEITVQGGYLDMMNYLTQLETMPWQLFWGNAKLDAKDHQKATLTLTLFTLSLDKKWLNI